MIETPFGHDLASARALNDELHQLLDEDQILRIDHFLGKQPVLDIQFLRFANVMLEPVWNREHVAHLTSTNTPDGCRTPEKALDLDRRDRGRRPRPVLTTALYSRFGSRGLDDFADKALSAMRHGFGGHKEKPTAALTHHDPKP